MSARERLMALIARREMHPEAAWCVEARSLLDAVEREHAHNLAERIRGFGSTPAGCTANWWDAATIPDAVADFIDPEVAG